MYNTTELANNYVIYIRKSTDEAGKQIMSTDDQLHYCKKMQRELWLNVIDVIEEKKSAKKPRQRPKFESMIERIESWEVDGIIAWHPDRLARNMGDAARIIDFIDDGSIIDLKFYTQQFSKDANGMMLLGLSFVLSKQYSDKLSTDVSRGQDRKHSKGFAIGRVKYGYTFNEKGEYIKSGSWTLFQEAWKWKIAGKHDTEILQIFEESGYTYAPMKGTKQSQNMKMTTQKLWRMFKDSFFYGVMTMRWEEVHLTDLYDFEPMISEEEFMKVENNNKRGKYKKPLKNNKSLWGKVVNIDYPSIEYKPQVISNRINKKYLYYVVNTKHKKRAPDGVNLKAIRAKKIVDAVDVLLKNISDNYCQESYKTYLTKAKGYYDLDLEDRRQRGYRLLRTNRSLQEESNDITLGLISKKDLTKEQKRVWNEEIKILDKRIKENELTMKKLKKEENEILPSFDMFLNTMKSLITSYKTMPWDKKLQIAETLVLNTYIKDWEVVNIELNEPFNDLLDFDNTVWFGM